jgi:WD40 repeat protein
VIITHAHLAVRASVLFLGLLLTACISRHVAEAPDFIYPDVHSGGSSVGFSHSGDLLASGGWEGTIHIWRLPAGEAMGHWQAHRDSVNGLAFSADDRRLITAGYDGMLAEWGVGGEPLRRIATPAAVTHMVASARADRVLTGHNDGTVRVWRMSDLVPLGEQKLHDGPVRAVAIDRHLLRYASSGADGTVRLWAENAPAIPLSAPPVDAWTLAFSPDGQQLYGGGWFRLLRWNLADNTLMTLPTEHHGIIRAIQFAADGASLATISRQTDSSVYFLDPQTGEVTRRFRRHELCGAALALSPHGRFLATTSDDASVQVWRLDRKVQ